MPENKSKHGNDPVSEMLEDDHKDDAVRSVVMRAAGDIAFNDGDSFASGVEGNSSLDNPFAVTAPRQYMFMAC